MRELIGVVLDMPCSKCGHHYSEHADGPCSFLVKFWGAMTECGCREFSPVPAGEDFAAPRPWHDCPPCPSCKARCGIPVRLADWNHRAVEGDTLVCPSCGAGWVGTVEESTLAERAYSAWLDEDAQASEVARA
ncbi:hypothetical protein [Myxococcus landrumensis]|uniref:Transcription factor zinc-finger domain-containing protein n=1 Tax=Myxococcus landrumensis TaxID=2813577 RepID=A0ABX7NIJ4_9BACT|nr:hypothetical protein [Myxococcus landrumus]QSQ17206.1 hypothetical protein JY572_14590 [Myxococcus landrumus]